MTAVWQADTLFRMGRHIKAKVLIVIIKDWRAWGAWPLAQGRLSCGRAGTGRVLAHRSRLPKRSWLLVLLLECTPMVVHQAAGMVSVRLRRVTRPLPSCGLLQAVAIRL